MARTAVARSILCNVPGRAARGVVENTAHPAFTGRNGTRNYSLNASSLEQLHLRHEPCGRRSQKVLREARTIWRKSRPCDLH
jgi:hypothetical protein